MKKTPTPLQDSFLIVPTWHTDHRGGFMETFRASDWEPPFPNVTFIQDNEAHSYYGVIRGMHYQKGEYAQAKLVRVLQGEIIDYIIDLRPSSSTYLQHFHCILSEENKHQLFIPKGFAHGYGVLSEKAQVLYKVDAPYAPDSEAGISPHDPFFQLDWKIPLEKQHTRERDLNWPLWKKK